MIECPDLDEREERLLDSVWERREAMKRARMKTSACGADTGPGGKGFGKGNTCARGGMRRYNLGGRGVESLDAPAKQTDTPAFKRWFKDSKAVDEHGNPLILFHGTRADFHEFRVGDESRDYGMLDRLLGPHFAEDADVTDVFSMGQYVWPSDFVVSERPGESWYRQDGELRFDGVPVVIFEPDDGPQRMEVYDPQKHGGTWGVRDRLGDRAHLRILPPGGKVLPVYLSVQNPLVVEPIGREMDQSAISRVVGGIVFAHDRQLFIDAYEGTGRSGETAGMMWDTLSRGEKWDGGQYDRYENFEDVASNYTGLLNGADRAQRARQVLQDLGYDGIKYHNTSQNEVKGDDNPWAWIVFDPTQIKSAVANEGEFDPDNPDIRKTYSPLLKTWRYKTDGENPGCGPRDEHGQFAAGNDCAKDGGDIRTSANFRRWFGKSQVVDKAGRPLVVHHGTNRKFDEFDPAYQGATDDGFIGRGFYFTPHEDYAADFGAVLSVYLKMENPLRVPWSNSWGDDSLFDARDALADLPGMPEDLRTNREVPQGYTLSSRVLEDGDWGYRPNGNNVRYYVAPQPHLYGTELEIYGREYSTKLSAVVGFNDERKDASWDAADTAGLFKSIGRKQVVAAIQEAGHDGIIAFDPQTGDLDELVVFHPTQIKSTDNAGTFDDSAKFRKTSPCGAGDEGNPGFQPDNDCAKGRGKNKRVRSSLSTDAVQSKLDELNRQIESHAAEALEVHRADSNDPRLHTLYQEQARMEADRDRLAEHLDDAQVKGSEFADALLFGNDNMEAADRDLLESLGIITSDELLPGRAAYNQAKMPWAEFHAGGQIEAHSDARIRLKEHVNDTLAKSISDRSPEELLAFTADLAAAERAHTSMDQDDLDAWRDGFRQEYENRTPEQLALESTRMIVDNWATSSSDHHVGSVATQIAARRMFGEQFDIGAESLMYVDSGVREAAFGLYKRNASIYDEVVRTMYDNTQQHLKDAGVEELVLMRGMRFKEHETPPDIASRLESGETNWQAGPDKAHMLRASIAQNPLSSWSTDAATSQRFASGFSRSTINALAVAVVPRERVFSTALTGLGCLTEGEVVLLGGNVGGYIVAQRNGDWSLKRTRGEILKATDEANDNL